MTGWRMRMRNGGIDSRRSVRASMRAICYPGICAIAPLGVDTHRPTSLSRLLNATPY